MAHITIHTQSLAFFHPWNKCKRSLPEHTSLPDVAGPLHVASGPALTPVTQALVLLRFPGDVMLPHTLRQFTGNILFLVVDPEKPYTPTDPSRLSINSVLCKTLPGYAE